MRGLADGAWRVVGGVVLALSMIAAAPVLAQSVQKCIAEDGHVTLTSGDCGAGERLAATYAAVPESVVPAAAAIVEPSAAHSKRGAHIGRAEASARVRPKRSSSLRRAASGDRCSAAREHRDETLRKVGLKRTFDLLRRLDDAVWEACSRGR